ncbi:GNAT family N-acetyltransferase [Streptomyces antimicrobicus]|uniref:GNAT family N-acetyltransferase n=1 Tax=Streptomyces antimicrobicus TaxID=2883108 RepID=A0ABS8BDN1_9ACTN|nr:GNAT family N-acetyltransferase [Streptomyces antimicrobicus]MCB5182750.1 GNAT family N-acetyltransferase [Streptomyces antimicrobicus]
MTTTLRPSAPLQQTATGARSRPYEIRVNSRRVGALVIAADGPLGPAVGELRELYVEEPDRGRGRATVAALAGEEVLRGWGCRRVRVAVPASSAGGLRLATALGYTESGLTLCKELPAAPPALPEGVGARPMTEAEYARWLPRAVASYAERCQERSGLGPEEARAFSAAQHTELLPQGPATEGMSISVLEAAAADRREPLGHVWVATGQELPGGGSGAYVYDVEVDAAHRGRGHGRGLLLQAERVALAAGARRIALFVDSGNTPARGLYASLGYRTTTVHLGKPLW